MVSRSRTLGKFVLIALALSGMCFAVRATSTEQTPFADVEIPKTPAGEQFSAWLAAFNSGDRAELEKFRSHFDKPDEHKVEGMLGFRQQTGGFELRKIEESSATKLTGLVQERDSDQFAKFAIEVEAAAPYHVTHLEIRAMGRPPGFALPRSSQSDLIAALRAKLEKDSAADKFSGAVLLGQRR